MLERTICKTLVLLFLSVPALGAAGFLGGYSGNIVTPDAVITPAGTWELSFHEFFDVQDNDITSIGLQYGLMPNLEVGVSLLDNDDSETVFNAKLRLLPETPGRPSIAVGAFDVGGSANFINDDPSFYVLISKNIARTATEIAGKPSKPLGLTVGFGSGLFDGVFAALDWTLQERLSIMAEFVDEGFRGDSLFNLGARFAITDIIRVDAAAIDFEDFAAGASFRTAF